MGSWDLRPVNILQYFMTTVVDKLTFPHLQLNFFSKIGTNGLRYLKLLKNFFLKLDILYFYVGDSNTFKNA